MLAFVLSKRFPAFFLDVELATMSRRLVLFGPSGSGKSLTLQCLAGLERPDRGSVRLGQRTLLDRTRGIDLPPERRRIGYVPQSAALFPHLSVAANVAYGLRRAPSVERQARVSTLVRLVRLHGFESRRPDQLSGGEQQRVALARALVIEPDLLLLDEPFSALDAPVRQLLRQELLVLQAQLGFAWVFVTHDLDEAYQLADEIAIYDRGRVLQAGPRDEVFYRPRTGEVARLVGVRNILPVSGAAPDRVVVESTGRELAVNTCFGRGGGAEAGVPLSACIRQEDIVVLRKGEPTSVASRGTRLAGTIVEERQLGFAISLRFAVPGAFAPLELWVDVPVRTYHSLNVARDKQWDLFIPSDVVHLMTRSGPATDESPILTKRV